MGCCVWDHEQESLSISLIKAHLCLTIPPNVTELLVARLSLRPAFLFCVFYLLLLCVFYFYSGAASALLFFKVLCKHWIVLPSLRRAQEFVCSISAEVTIAEVCLHLPVQCSLLCKPAFLSSSGHYR